MRLSEIRGERVFDVIADIIEPCCNIAQDKEAAEIFDRSVKRPEGVTPAEFALSRIKSAVPKLVRSHKDDIVAILSSIEGVSPDEYREGLTMPKLIQGVYEILTDEDLLGFLS